MHTHSNTEYFDKKNVPYIGLSKAVRNFFRTNRSKTYSIQDVSKILKFKFRSLSSAMYKMAKFHPRYIKLVDMNQFAHPSLSTPKKAITKRPCKKDSIRAFILDYMFHHRNNYSINDLFQHIPQLKNKNKSTIYSILNEMHKNEELVRVGIGIYHIKTDDVTISSIENIRTKLLNILNTDTSASFSRTFIMKTIGGKYRSVGVIITKLLREKKIVRTQAGNYKINIAGDKDIPDVTYKIMEFLSSDKEKVFSRESIIQEVDCKKSTIDSALVRMVKRGQIKKVKLGYYQVK